MEKCMTNPKSEGYISDFGFVIHFSMICIFNSVQSYYIFSKV